VENTVFKPVSEPVRMGIDVGSTTVKVVVLKADDSVVFSQYERHRADIRSTIISVVGNALDSIEQNFPQAQAQTVSVKVTGSGGLAVAHWLSIPFIQEVVASTTAVKKRIPQRSAKMRKKSIPFILLKSMEKSMTTAKEKPHCSKTFKRSLNEEISPE